MEEQTMKKTYMEPTMDVVRIETMGMLAASRFTVDSTQELESGEILSRETIFFED